MYIEYFYWQYFLAPRWILSFYANLQRAILNLFSVKLMLKTLFSHWHKDIVPYRPGSISDLALAFSWNLISRAIGFLLRSVILSLWIATEIIFIPLAISLLIIFFLWPLLMITAIAAGIALIII